MIIWRSAEEMLAEGKNQEATDITDAYFKDSQHEIPL
jgi:hypothetical protein